MEDDTTAAAMASDEAPTEEAAPPTCDHSWRRCPFYCPACEMTFVIRDTVVAFQRRVYSFKGETLPLSNSDQHLVTELAGWSEGEDPPTWP